MAIALTKKTIILGLIGGMAFCLAAILLYLSRVSGTEDSADKTNVPDFADFQAGTERKKAFFGYFLPLIADRNQELVDTRSQLLSLKEKTEPLTERETAKLIELGKRYNISAFDPQSNEDWERLLRRVDIVPASLALAQAANESAWGTSRFSREGYNYYGQWCFKKGCGIVPANRDTGKTHEVADFDSPQESVNAYIRNINSHNAYTELRTIRATLRAQEEPITGPALATGLERYSERGEEYIKEIQSMIRYNKLDQHDL